MAPDITDNWLFVQLLVEYNIKENMKAPYYSHFCVCGEPSVTGGFPPQRDSNKENVSFTMQTVGANTCPKLFNHFSHSTWHPYFA